MSKVEEPKGHKTQCWVASKPALNSPLGPVGAMGGRGKVVSALCCAVLCCTELTTAAQSNAGCPGASQRCR